MSACSHIEQKTFVEASCNHNIHWEFFFAVATFEGLAVVSFQTE